MPDPALVLGATAVIGDGLRVAGLAIGGRLSPGGLLAQVPLSARLAGLAAGGLAHAGMGGRLLPALGAGAAVLGLAWHLAG